MDENDEGQHQMRLEIVMGVLEYPNDYLRFTNYTTDFTMNVLPATCNCNLLEWIVPSMITLDTELMADPIATETVPMATINADSRLTEPAIRICYPDNGAPLCDETSTIVLVKKGENSIPSPPMTFDNQPTMLLTVEPTISSQIGTYVLEITQTVLTGHGPMTFDAITVTIDCIIQEIQKPTPLENTIYHVLANAQGYELTPQYTQWPPCDYAISETISWELNGAPITIMSDYMIKIESDDPVDHGVYNITLSNYVTY